MTSILSACISVVILWEMRITVAFSNFSLSAFCIFASVSASTAERESSKTMTAACSVSIRAIAARDFGEAHADEVVAVWADLSEAIRNLTGIRMTVDEIMTKQEKEKLAIEKRKLRLAEKAADKETETNRIEVVFAEGMEELME